MLILPSAQIAYEMRQVNCKEKKQKKKKIVVIKNFKHVKQKENVAKLNF